MLFLLMAASLKIPSWTRASAGDRRLT